jgi:hypothetical protein
MLLQLARVAGYTLVDRIRRHAPESSDEIPSSFALINPLWLTSVLCRNAPGARVEQVTLLGGDSGSTDRQRIALRYNAEGIAARLPESLLIKATMSFATRVAGGATQTVAGECEFYNRIRPKLEIEAPQGNFAAYERFLSCHRAAGRCGGELGR